jgi:Bifunctional DNA primase/polymerase, N-terminal
MILTSVHPRTLSPAGQVATAALRAGISVVPMRADGSKQPAVSGWKVYQEHLPTGAELAQWFRDPALGLALITGAVSGNLEALDFDDGAVFAAWRERIRRDRQLDSLYQTMATGYEEVTPAGGRHLLYRCSEIAGNQKLALRPIDGPQKYKTLIETRGEGGLLIVDPSSGSVHPSGKPYRRVRGSVTSIATIPPAERAALFASVRQFNQVSPADPVLRVCPAPRPSSFPSSGTRPGDLFNQRATWDEVLAPHGWELVRVVGEVGQWRKPAKEGTGISATTNYQGSDLLYVFSTSTIFEPQQGYTKFHAYTLLNHGGDFAAAARALAAQGYSEHA